jgi:hypothetical protein
MSDLAFEQMLAQYNQDYKDAEEYSDWMPPDGNYIVTITKIAKDVSTKDGNTLCWWKVTARIESDVSDPKIYGQEFTLKFVSTKALGILKGFARSLNGGEVVNSIADADKVISESKGKVLDVKVVTTTSTKNGKDYTNCFVQKVVDTEDVVESSSQDEGTA